MDHRCCCVVNCKNNGKNSLCRFYSFPKASWKLEQRMKWIAAVKRINVDGSPWFPKLHDTICSEHFIGGKKSDVSSSPSYVPTIFPKIYRKKAVNNSHLNCDSFSCMVCSSSFISESSLLKHMEIHAEEINRIKVEFVINEPESQVDEQNIKIEQDPSWDEDCKYGIKLLGNKTEPSFRFDLDSIKKEEPSQTQDIKEEYPHDYLNEDDVK